MILTLKANRKKLSIVFMAGTILIAFLCNLMVPLLSRDHCSRFVVSQVDIREIYKTLYLYKQNTGYLPSNDQGLELLVTGTNKELYLPKLPLDPWGNEYIYTLDNHHNNHNFKVYSGGDNGVDDNGIEDDVTLDQAPFCSQRISSIAPCILFGATFGGIPVVISYSFILFLSQRRKKE